MVYYKIADSYLQRELLKLIKLEELTDVKN